LQNGGVKLSPDLSGFGNDGTTSNISSLTDSHHGGNAYSFGGTNSINAIPQNAGILGANTRSFSGWVKPTSISIGQVGIFGYGVDTSSHIHYILSSSVNNGDIYVYNNGGDVQTTTGGMLTANKWTHVVVTYNGGIVATGNSSILIYINGVSQTVQYNGALGTLATQAGTVYVGSFQNASGYFSGGIEGIRWYNRVLDPSEITQLYAEPYAGIIDITQWSRVGAAASTLVLGWLNDRTDILPKPVIATSAAPAFVSTFKTAAIAGMEWFEPIDQPSYGKPIKAHDRTAQTLLNQGTTVGISGMAWFTQRENDIVLKGKYLTDPAPINYSPSIVTWSFMVGDAIFLPDAPRDLPPGFEQVPAAQAVGISGMGWFEPWDQPNYSKKSIDRNAPAFVSTFQTAGISGMAWFEPPPDKVKVVWSFSDAPALQQPIVQLAPTITTVYDFQFFANVGKLMGH
jgi:hypothetical protein